MILRSDRQLPAGLVKETSTLLRLYAALRGIAGKKRLQQLLIKMPLKKLYKERTFYFGMKIEIWNVSSPSSIDCYY